MPKTFNRHEPVTQVPEKGDLYPTWFSGRGDGLSTVIDVYPEKPTNKDYATHVLRLSAPKTRRGWIEMSVKVEEQAR